VTAVCATRHRASPRWGPSCVVPRTVWFDESMTARPPSDELLRQEVRELTDLLRTDDAFADLREVLTARGLSASGTLLAGLIDGEDNCRYGAFVTTAGEIIRFECAPDDRVVLWEQVDDPAAWLVDFQAIEIAVAMKEAGLIS
jgi:hypothetical protein